MIPFSICGAIVKLIYEQNHIMQEEYLEVRILDLSTKSFSFRLPKGYLKGKQIDSLEIKFYSFEPKKYLTLFVEKESFTISLLKEEKYYDLYEAYIFCKDFEAYAGMLSREYLDYIDYKLNLSDEELSNKMCDYPLNEEDDFSQGRREIEKAFFENENNITDAGKLEEVFKVKEIGILLENRQLIADFMDKPFDKFIEDYFDRSYATNHPISKALIKRIYIGNPYCLLLFPKKEVIIALIEKAKALGLEVTIVLAPVSEMKVTEVISDIDYIFNKHSMGKLELQVNDWGSYYHFRKSINVTKGLLLHKGRKDPRDKYRGIKSELLSRGEKEIFFPFYQTNTSTFCCLNALVTKNDRGKSCRVEACEGYCSRYEILYPKHLNMVGNYNSILAFDENFVSDIISMDSKAERLVINL